MHDLSRRNFLTALVGAATALQLEAAKTPNPIPAPAPAPNVEWGLLSDAGPIVDFKHFNFWQRTKIQKAGEYTLLRAVMPFEFRLRSLCLMYDPSCRLDTLKTFLGSTAGTSYFVTLRCGTKDPLLDYFCGPASLMPFGDRTPIYPEILIPAGSIINLQCKGSVDLGEELLVETLFEGVLAAPGGTWVRSGTESEDEEDLEYADEMGEE